MTKQERVLLDLGAMGLLNMDSDEVDQALESMGLDSDTCSTEAARDACRAWKDEQNGGTVDRGTVFAPMTRTEPYKSIEEAARGYCKESPHLGQIITRSGVRGIWFTGPDASQGGDFIPFFDLGYSLALGFFEKSVFPKEVSIYDKA